jgi:hypothetical protein
MITASFNKSAVEQLSKLLKGEDKKVRQQLYISVKAAATKTKGHIARELKKKCGLQAQTLKKFIRIKIPDKTKPGAVVIVRDSKVWLSLRHFNAKQIATGTQAKVNPSAGPTVYQSAFMGPRAGVMSIKLRGNVYKRVGASRNPIEMVRAPDPVDVFNANNMETITVQFSRKELTKQVERRIQFLTAKLQGKIK